MTTLVSLRNLIEAHGGRLNIPVYQRHYVWGQRRSGGKDSAAYLVQTVVNAYRRGKPLFLQGLTVTCAGDIVDGQQRLTCLRLLLGRIGAVGNGADGSPTPVFRLTYSSRAEAEAFFEKGCDRESASQDEDERDQDVYFFRKTLRSVDAILGECGLNRGQLGTYILDNIYFLHIGVDREEEAVTLFGMMNGTKSPMDAADVIKADLIRLASSERQPYASEMELWVVSARYAAEWDAWTHWWHDKEVQACFEGCGHNGIDLLLALCMGCGDGEVTQQPLTHERFRRMILDSGEKDYHAAKHLFDKLRRTQRRIEEAYHDPGTYNRMRAVLLQQRSSDRYRFLHTLLVSGDIDAAELDRHYRLSFLGMSIDEIAACRDETSGARGLLAERLEMTLAAISMPDVYHGEGKREVFSLLLRLNIDEDTKLGRKFDFSAWGNRSIEHIHSKSKVWHTDSEGRICDGNDNPLRCGRRQIENDRSYISRESIVDRDGVHLTEHCIGNLVLLYGQNNADFGNATFEEKKQMFLRPGDATVFRSRNLLHSVCVFARDSWNAASIADNYNLTIKNFKEYYGFK